MGGLVGGALRSFHGSVGGFVGGSSCLFIVYYRTTIPVCYRNPACIFMCSSWVQNHHKNTTFRVISKIESGEYKCSN